MERAAWRYEELGLGELLCRAYDYPYACGELSNILRHSYKRAPKNLQSLLFHHTLSAFRLLPQTQTSRGISAAKALAQAAEAVLPKQKRGTAVAEFKQAIVACKRRSKPQLDLQGLAQMPQDVLIHIFSFLDVHSLADASLVCRSWNSAASDNMLWQSHYARFFGKYDDYAAIKDEFDEHALDWVSSVSCQKEVEAEQVFDLDWREAFKKAYIGKSSWSSTSHWGLCRQCESIIWLRNMKCTSSHGTSKDVKGPCRIKPMSLHQVVDYLLGESLSEMSSSDSDSDMDGALFTKQRLPKLWAYSKHIGILNN